jgi:hypothetical protein
MNTEELKKTIQRELSLFEEDGEDAFELDRWACGWDVGWKQALQWVLENIEKENTYE